MLVTPITDINYFFSRTIRRDLPSNYVVHWHEQQSESHFQTMPTFVLHIENCSAHSLPFLITSDRNMLSDHVWPLLHNTKYKPNKTHNLWTEWKTPLELNLPPVTKNFVEHDCYVWLPIDEQSAENAWHIWIDVIGKMRLLERSDPRPLEKYVFILSNPSRLFEKIRSELMPNLKYFIMSKDSVWHFNHLIVPSMQNHQDGILVPELPNWLRQRFGIQNFISKKGRKIFISREDAPARRLYNREEVFMALQGWETVTLSTLPILKQLEIFSETTDVISTHGAGLVNTLFCARGTRVIEISQKELLDKKPYPILSHLLGHRHRVLLGDPVPLSGKKPAGVKRKRDYNDIKVDYVKLLDVVKSYDN